MDGNNSLEATINVGLQNTGPQPVRKTTRYIQKLAGANYRNPESRCAIWGTKSRALGTVTALLCAMVIHMYTIVARDIGVLPVWC